MQSKKLIAFMVFASLLAIVAFYRLRADVPRDVQNIKKPNEPISKKTTDTPNTNQPRIQIVFALDATGSMSGLIDAAKEKIWSIAGSLAQAEPAPVIEMGLLFYRDRGDEFVTKKIVLSSHIDDIYEKLMQITAGGGGDQPESVNQALHEAITQFTWDSSLNTYKTVFLVGDCPPHMDYANDINYKVSCRLAQRHDIILNTILMGNNPEAKQIWNDIAACNQGSFTQVGMDANDIAINTPYDDEIAAISDQLDETRIYYGNEFDKSVSREKISKSRYITKGSKSNVKAQRAEYNLSKAGKDSYYGKKELLENYKEKTIELETIKTEELPEVMKDMPPAERKKYLDKQLSVRDSLNSALLTISKKRQEFISTELSKRTPGEVNNSFSNQIYKSIQKQTEKKKIYLKSSAKF